MINLMPPATKTAINYAIKNLLLLRIIIVVSGLAALMAGVLFFGILIVNSDENSLNKSVDLKESQLASFEETLSEANSLANTIETINTLISQEEKFSILLQQIGSLMPDGASLAALTLTNDRAQKISITATTNTRETGTTLQANLANSELFSGADIQSISANLDEDDNPINYTVIIITAFGGVEEVPVQPVEEITTEGEES